MIKKGNDECGMDSQGDQSLDENINKKGNYLGGTFFFVAAVGSTGLLSEDCDDSSDFLEAFSATFRPFTSMTVTKSPACDAGRFLACVGLVLSTATEIEMSRNYYRTLNESVSKNNYIVIEFNHSLQHCFNINNFQIKYTPYV